MRPLSACWLSVWTLTPSSEDVLTELCTFLSPTDRPLVKEICHHWIEELDRDSGPPTSKPKPDIVPFVARWSDYMDANDLLQCVDISMPRIIGTLDSSNAHTVLALSALRSLCSLHGYEGTSGLLSRITSLLDLARRLPENDALSTAILTALDASYSSNLQLNLSSGETHLEVLTEGVEKGWALRRPVLTIPDEYFRSLVEQSNPSANAVAIAALCIHCSANARDDFATWISKGPSDILLLKLVPAIEAFLLATQAPAEGGRTEIPPGLPTLLFTRIFDLRAATDVRRAAAGCIKALIETGCDTEISLRDACSKAVEMSSHAGILNWEAVSLLRDIGTILPDWKNPGGPLINVIESGLQWLVRRFAEDPKDSVELLPSLRVFGEFYELPPALRRTEDCAFLQETLFAKCRS